MFTDFSDTLTNEALPKTSATITIRVIKSFEFRVERNLVLRELNLETTTVGELKKLVLEDTFKLYTKAHGTKTSNLTINLDHDDWILENEDKTLVDYGLENESELSFFNRKAYDEYKANPETRWES